MLDLYLEILDFMFSEIEPVFRNIGSVFFQNIENEQGSVFNE